MANKIIIISDLWGSGRSRWVEHFRRILESNYSIQFYDACLLGSVDTRYYDERLIHQQFVEFGIDQAADKLIAQNEINAVYIGCSVGGVIAWRAGLKGLPMKKLITISSTRLRRESQKPKCEVINFFGKEDEYKPEDIWLNSLGFGQSFSIDGGHDIYADYEAVKFIINKSKL